MATSRPLASSSLISSPRSLASIFWFSIRRHQLSSPHPRPPAMRANPFEFQLAQGKSNCPSRSAHMHVNGRGERPGMDCAKSFACHGPMPSFGPRISPRKPSKASCWPWCGGNAAGKEMSGIQIGHPTALPRTRIVARENIEARENLRESLTFWAR